MEGSDEITVVVADDHPVVRSGLCALIDSQPGMDIVAEAADVPETIRKVKAYRPEVLVLDLMMPGGPGGECVPRLREASPKTQIVVLTMSAEPDHARAVLRGGASGYVLKERAQGTLIDVIRRIAQGGSYVDPHVGLRLAREPEEARPPDGLTDREVEVLGMIALGYTNREIGQELFISMRTVETHRAHIQQKIGLTSRAELVQYARDRGLIDYVGASMVGPLPERPVIP